MGNRSKPSQACEQCRVKRRRCDLKEPSCSQCQRAAISCPGYKDAFTLRLKDETHSTASRVQSSRNSAKHTRPITELGDSKLIRNRIIKSESSMMASGRDSLFHPLDRPHSGYVSGDQEDPTYEDRRLLAIVANACLPDEAALSYFMHTYATHSSFYYLPRIYDKLIDQAGNKLIKLNLEKAVSVPALLLLSKEMHEPSLLATARCRYTTVLAATQEALSDPHQATQDSTLASVLLLALVEGLEFHGRDDPTAWDAHTFGAATLLEMRGAKQLENGVSRQLYCHASANIKRRCALRMLRVPDRLSSLHQELMTLAEKKTIFGPSDLVTLHASVVLENFASLRVDMAEGRHDPPNWLSRAVGLSDELERLVASLLLHAPYETVPFEASPFYHDAVVTSKIRTFHYGSEFHSYPSPRLARRWNDLRMMQVYVSEHIRDSIRAFTVAYGDCTTLPSVLQTSMNRSTEYLEQALRVAEENSIGVLQSVPYLLHMTDATTLAASSLLLPLAGIGLSGMVSINLRFAAREILDYMDRDLNIPQAAESVQLLREKEELEMWVTIPSCL